MCSRHFYDSDLEQTLLSHTYNLEDFSKYDYFVFHIETRLYVLNNYYRDLYKYSLIIDYHTYFLKFINGGSLDITSLEKDNHLLNYNDLKKSLFVDEDIEIEDVIKIVNFLYTGYYSKIKGRAKTKSASTSHNFTTFNLRYDHLVISEGFYREFGYNILECDIYKSLSYITYELLKESPLSNIVNARSDMFDVVLSSNNDSGDTKNKQVERYQSLVVKDLDDDLIKGDSYNIVFAT